MTDSYPNQFDKNKFTNILAIIDSNKFGCKNKIGKFKYIDIKDLVNNIRNNAISEISAKRGLNTLKEIKNVGITKQKKTHAQTKRVMKLIQRFIRYNFNQQNTKIRKSRRQNENVNENVNDKTLMSSKDENENEDKDDKTLMPSNEDDYK